MVGTSNQSVPEMAIDEGIPHVSPRSSTRGQAMDQPWTAQQPIGVGAIAIGICHIFHHLRPSRPVLLAPERNGSLRAPDRCYKYIYIYNLISSHLI